MTPFTYHQTLKRICFVKVLFYAYRPLPPLPSTAFNLYVLFVGILRSVLFFLTCFLLT